MSTTVTGDAGVEISPATAERWTDVEALLGVSGEAGLADRCTQRPPPTGISCASTYDVARSLRHALAVIGLFV